MLAFIRDLQDQMIEEPVYNAAENFKDRMKQIATKAKVQHALEAIEQAANRGEFSIFIPNGIFIREELEAYGLTVNGDVVTWA